MEYDEFIEWVETSPANQELWCDEMWDDEWAICDDMDAAINWFGSHTPLTAEELKEYFVQHPDEKAQWERDWKVYNAV